MKGLWDSKRPSISSGTGTESPTVMGKISKRLNETIKSLPNWDLGTLAIGIQPLPNDSLTPRESKPFAAILGQVQNSWWVFLYLLLYGSWLHILIYHQSYQCRPRRIDLPPAGWIKCSEYGPWQRMGVQIEKGLRDRDEVHYFTLTHLLEYNWTAKSMRWECKP